LNRQRQLVVATNLYASDFGGVLPTKNGSGALYLLSTRAASVRELHWQDYIGSVETFRCPSLRGRDDWNRNFAPWFNIGYLGYCWDGYSTYLLPGGANPFLGGSAGYYWVSLDKVPGDYVLISDNLVDPDAGWRGFLEMNFNAHRFGQPEGAHVAYADGSVRWRPFRPEGGGHPTSVVDGNFYGPYWDAYLAKEALIVKDDNEYSFVANEARRFFWQGGVRGQDPARGHVTTAP
jgi:prepilin-type processing-associated H-X9-DG protein